MQTDFIIVQEYCRKTNTDPSFFILLEEVGLINVFIEEGEKYFQASQLIDLERYSRMYYDLSINIEGIDAIDHMLKRMQELQAEVKTLKDRLSLYE
ncbi:chaperone modulator CbpM [Bacteroides sp. 51]|uniref:chaperone modulator CbpM n=1 Tax=Bacteroides sp. 51 TaxID=2302938 RepID=UPI0013D57C31|nr:chaperone modulator CbpM [Bacteroides sp. 51]NDV82368.1 hypothetical protein [Bacteroides sp. 51]